MEGERDRKEKQVTALVPMKGYSERVPNKNLRHFCGRPLCRWVILKDIKKGGITQVESGMISRILRRGKNCTFRGRGDKSR